MNCDPQALAEAAKCYRCIPNGMKCQIWTYLLCQWASSFGPLPSYLIDDQGNYILDDQGNKIIVHL